MSKSITDALKTHLQGEVTTIATCWKITRLDGVVFYFTDHDVDLDIEGNTYEASSGAMLTNIQQKLDMSVDNVEATPFIDSDQISEEDVTAGKFDYATVDIFLVDYTSFEVVVLT